MKRRQFLALFGITPLPLTGCLGRDETATRLSYSAEVVNQRSASSPATIVAELNNNSVLPAQIIARETIVLELEDGPNHNLLLLPDTEVGRNNPPEEPIEGCWRYTDGMYTYRDIALEHTILPFGNFEETYSLFTVGRETQCLPDGEYRFRGSVSDGNENELQLVLEISIKERHVSITESHITDEQSERSS